MLAYLIQKFSKKLLRHVYTKINVDYQNRNEPFSIKLMARMTDVFAESLGGLMELGKPCTQTTQKAADIPSEKYTFLSQLSWEGWSGFFSRISQGLQPFASTTVEKEGNPSLDQLIAAALREKESSSSTL